MKTLIKRALTKTPYRIVRFGATHRFQAIEEILPDLSHRGYRPSSVIDGAANSGEFARLAGRIWLDTKLHLIEPRLSCRPALEAVSCIRGDVNDIAAVAGQCRDNRARQGDVRFVRRENPLARDTAWS